MSCTYLRLAKHSIRAMALVCFVPCICSGQSARDVARDSFKSVVLLEMNDASGRPLCLGSGFFIAPGIVATNAHVIAGAYSGTAKLIGSNDKFRINGTVAIDGHADLALLNVDSAAPSLNLVQGAPPAVGDSVYVVGNPLGLEGTFSDGIVSAIRHLGDDTYIQMTAPISPGSSGGPVMDASGSVLGIAVATFQDGQNLNLAIPVKYLADLAAKASRTPISLGSGGNQRDREKSMLAGLGEKIEDGIVVSNFSLTYSGDYHFRLTNKLSDEVSNIKIYILYSDVSGAAMDYEEYTFPGPLPPNLTKSIDGHSELRKDQEYYLAEYIRSFPNSVYGVRTSDQAQRILDQPIDPKFIEVRVVSFATH